MHISFLSIMAQIVFAESSTELSSTVSSAVTVISMGEISLSSQIAMESQSPTTSNTSATIQNSVNVVHHQDMGAGTQRIYIFYCLIK